MLLETDADADGAEEARDGSTISTADTYDDEVALEILKGYLPLEDDGAVLDARLDVTGLRAQLRGIAEEAAAERERQEQAARRTSALSLSRSRDGAEALSPPPPGSSSLTEEQEAEGRSESLAQHAARDAEALSFLEQLLPDADPEVVDFVFCIKCLCSRERAADLLLGLAGDGKALASLGEEKVRVCLSAAPGHARGWMIWAWLITCANLSTTNTTTQERYEASQREAREKERREQEAAEVAAKQVNARDVDDLMVYPLSNPCPYLHLHSHSTTGHRGPVRRSSHPLGLGLLVHSEQISLHAHPLSRAAARQQGSLPQ